MLCAHHSCCVPSVEHLRVQETQASLLMLEDQAQMGRMPKTTMELLHQLAFKVRSPQSQVVMLHAAVH